jgi:hypothetical protein
MRNAWHWGLIYLEVPRSVRCETPQKATLGHIVLDAECVALGVLLAAFHDEVGGQLEGRDDVKSVGIRTDKKARAGIIAASAFDMANNLGYPCRVVERDEHVEIRVLIPGSKIDARRSLPANSPHCVGLTVLGDDVLADVQRNLPSIGSRQTGACSNINAAVPVVNVDKAWVLQVDRGSDSHRCGKREGARDHRE